MPRAPAKRPVGRPRKTANTRKRNVFDRILEADEEEEVLDKMLFSPTDRIEETLTERHDTYGYFIYLARISQRLKKVLYNELAARKKDLAPDQIEAIEMILHKIARIVNGDADHIDSWHDISGYATLVADRLKGNVR
jgi:hypothetical protein